MFSPWRWPQMPTGRKTSNHTLAPEKIYCYHKKCIWNVNEAVQVDCWYLFGQSRTHFPFFLSWCRVTKETVSGCSRPINEPSRLRYAEGPRHQPSFQWYNASKVSPKTTLLCQCSSSKIGIPISGLQGVCEKVRENSASSDNRLSPLCFEINQSLKSVLSTSTCHNTKTTELYVTR